MPPSKTVQDVRPRRPDSAISKRKVEKGGQKARHLGQDFEPKTETIEKACQNYLLAHLLKGGLPIRPHVV